jgi:hypothetical protein
MVEDAEEEDASDDELTASNITFNIEEGDRVWATGLIPAAQYVRATSTISQRLVEGLARNLKAKPTLLTQKWIKKPNPRLRQDLWAGLLGRRICETPKPQTLGPRHRTGTRGPIEEL